jgi:hypothetical protein
VHNAGSRPPSSSICSRSSGLALFTFALAAAVTLGFGALSAGCRPAHRLGAVSADVPKCNETKDCPYAYECQAGQCRESECNIADANSTVGTRSCAKGVCEYDNEDDAAHGNGTCSSGF